MATTPALDTRGSEGFEHGGWREAHATLSRLAGARAAADAEEGRWLLAARRAEVHRHLGYGGFTEYIERLFGYSPRTTLDKLRVAEALEGLPVLDGALAAGQLGWCAVRELTRVARPGTEKAWLEAARGRTVRELEELVSGKAPGADPGEPSQPALRRYVLRFELSADTYALFRDALAEVKRQGGGTLSDDDALLTLARQALGGPSDAGRSSYQVAIDLCPRCGRAEQHSNGKAITVSPVAVDVACCDGQHLGASRASAANERAIVAVANENASAKVDGRPDLPPVYAGTASPGGVVARAGEDAEALPSGLPSAARGGTASPGGVVARAGEDAEALPSGLPSAARGGTASPGGVAARAPADAEPLPPARPTNAHAGTRPTAPTNAHAGTRPVPQRASQTIPPAVRRAVLWRDHHRCRVPGCSHTSYVDVHHLQPRAEGGLNTPANLITLCAAHHRAVHRGELIISGTESELVFHHADGTPYGAAPDADRAEAHAKVFSALRQLGFREREARAVLSELRADANLLQTSVSELLRQALMRIRASGG